jgi:hypothetical protein
MRVSRTRRWTRPHTVRFEGLAETHARTWPRRHVSDPAVAVPYGGAVACPRTGSVRSLDDCAHCEHFVNLRPDPDRQGATLRCLCCDDDPLSRRVPGEADWCTVPPELPVASARLVTWLNNASLLVVARGEEVLGVVHAGDLQEDDGGTVAARMITDPWSLPLVATLGDALEALRELRVPGLLVVDADLELVSLVCASHLGRLGVPSELLRR